MNNHFENGLKTCRLYNTYVCVCARAWVCVYICMFLCMYVHTCVCACVCVYMYVRMYVCTYVLLPNYSILTR